MHHRHLSTGYPPRNVFNGVSSGLLLVLVSALLISSVAATQIRSTNNSQLVGIDRQRRDGGITCPEFRPFVCYVYEELGQDYPAWLKKVGDDSDADKMKCATCAVEKFKECRSTDSFTANIAAGLDKNPYDVFDPLQPKYCPKGGRQAGEKCDPLHLCLPDPKAIDPQGTPPYYTLRRALSGPYASLKSEEETIDLLASLKVPESPAGQTSVDKEKAETQQGARVKRQGSALPDVSYPRCIKTDGLPADQKAIVQADELLDCDKNPFYKELGNESLTVTKLPLCTEVDPNQKFCLSTEDDDKTLMVIIVVAVVGTVLLIVGAVGLWLWVRSRRQKREKKEPVNSPKSQGTKNNSDEEEKSAE
ncbi:unnamed protein product, partial [Mesorhabditis spiculigera]